MEPRTRLLQRQLLMLWNGEEPAYPEQPEQSENPDRPAKPKNPWIPWTPVPGSTPALSVKLLQTLEENGVLLAKPTGESFPSYQVHITDHGRSIIDGIWKGAALGDDQIAWSNDHDPEAPDPEWNRPLKSKVFVVHGSDIQNNDSMANQVVRHLRHSGYEANYLDPEPTTHLLDAVAADIEAAGVAVCVWETDREQPESTHMRPNVLLETGLVMGHLGKERTVIIRVSDEIAIPSDYLGITYLRLDDWEKKLPGSVASILASKMG